MKEAEQDRQDLLHSMFFATNGEDIKSCWMQKAQEIDRKRKESILYRIDYVRAKRSVKNI